MGNEISVTEYAERRGVTRTSVLAAIRAGRLDKSVQRKGKFYIIEPDLADREWAENTQLDRGEHNNRLMQAAQDDAPTEGYAASRAKKEKYEAELARLKYEQQSGILVEVEIVKKEAFRIGRMIRDGMLNIPDRVAAELSGMDDSFAIHRRLTEEIRKVLESALGPEHDA